MSREAGILRVPAAAERKKKECPVCEDWRRERNCQQTLSVRRETGRW
jgi:hypothetical protein